MKLHKDNFCYREITIYNCLAGISFIILWNATYYFFLPNERIPWNYIVYGLLTPIILHYTKTYSTEKTKYIKIIAIIFAILMSLGLTVGFSIARTYNFELCIGSTRAFIIWGLKLITYIYIIYNITLYLIIKAENQSKENYSPLRHPCSNKKLFLIFLTSKIPYFISFYPCIWEWDDVTCLGSFTPSHVLFNWHPFFIAIIQKLFFNIGYTIGYPSLGLALFTLILFLITSAIMVYAIRIFGRLGVNVKYQTILMIIFSIFPLFPLISMKISKDGIFSYSIMLYVLTLLDIQIRRRHKQTINNKLLLVNCITAFFVCFSRHQGIYFIIVQFIILSLVYKELIKKWCIIYIPLILLYYTTINVVYPKINIAPISKGEMYGPLFQQSAFCIIHNPKVISQQERTAFYNIIDIEPSEIEHRFSYYSTDNIKLRYHYQPIDIWNHCHTRNYFSEEEEKTALKNYIKSYITTFKNNPYFCILAELNIINLFFYNDYSDFQTNKDTRRFLWEFYNWKECPRLLPETDFYANISLYNTINKVFRHLSWYPITEFAFSYFCYTWLVVLCFIVLLFRKDVYGITSFMPTLLSLLTLFICPLAQFRYFLPIIVSIPILISYIFHSNGATNKQTNNCSTDSMLQ